MAVDPTPIQSDCITSLRTNLALVISALQAIDGDRTKAASLGGFGAFGSGAFAGNNADLDSAHIDAAITAALKLRPILLDPATGLPTADYLAIVRVAR